MVILLLQMAHLILLQIFFRYLELTKLKMRYLKNEFDAFELNKRVSFYMHDYSGQKKAAYI
jgi:hypothetical protein